MPQVTLNRTGIRTTTLGFGCGGLMRVTSARQRQRVLAEAFAGGIRHFDVAPIYGLGKAESELGAFVQGRRDQLVLATKFGLKVKRASGVATALHSMARRALAAIPALRTAVRRQAGMFYAPKDFGVAAARQSLEESLRALRTDYLDLFLLHEPELADVRGAEIHDYLQRAKESGLIRAWGVAGYPQQLRPICTDMPELASVIQVPNDVVGRQLEGFRDMRAAFITFSPYSEALKKLSDGMAVNPAAVDAFVHGTGVDPRRRSVLAGLLLAYCLRANPSGVTLFFSGRTEGVRESLVTWEAGFPEETLQAFIRLAEQLAAVGDSVLPLRGTGWTNR